jgi:type I restriction enzyme S subunit
VSWKISKIGDIAKINYGYTAKSSLGIKGPHYLRITDIQDGNVDWSKVPNCQISDVDLSKFLLKDGDIVFARTGATTGKSYLINDVPEAVFASYLIKATVNKSICLPKYVFYFFQSKEYWTAIQAGISGAAQGGFNASKLAELKIPLPNLSIQQKLVAKLDTIFAQIDIAMAAAEANAKNAEALFQSYVTEVFETEKYDFKLVKFGTTASFVRGPFGGSLKKSIFVEKGYAVYEQQHAIYNQFSDIRYFIDESKFEEMKRFELKSGDLIMSCSGTMGKIAIVPENIEQGVINQALLKISPNKNVMGEYIARLLSSKYFQDTLTKLSGGAAIQNVPAVSVLKDIEVPIPSIKNQKLIVDIIDVLESNKIIIKNSYKCKSKEFTSLKQSILKRAFNGELVKD